MKPKQQVVLRELAELDVIDFGDGWWRPYRVRYFRDLGLLHPAEVSLDSAKVYLNELHHAGLVDKQGGRDAEGRTTVVAYRINEAGRRALEGES